MRGPVPHTFRVGDDLDGWKVFSTERVRNERGQLLVQVLCPLCGRETAKLRDVLKRRKSCGCGPRGPRPAEGKPRPAKRSPRPKPALVARDWSEWDDRDWSAWAGLVQEANHAFGTDFVYAEAMASEHAQIQAGKGKRR